MTSNDAGLSVPDWPTSFGSLYKIPHMVGGVRFEHSHRMVAEFVGLLTIGIAIWTWRSRPPPLDEEPRYRRPGHGDHSRNSGRHHGAALSATGGFHRSCRARPDVLLHCGGYRVVHRPKWVEEVPPARARHPPPQPADSHFVFRSLSCTFNCVWVRCSATTA